MKSNQSQSSLTYNFPEIYVYLNLFNSEINRQSPDYLPNLIAVTSLLTPQVSKIFFINNFNSYLFNYLTNHIISPNLYLKNNYINLKFKMT